MTTLERFWAKVEKTDACWNWTGGVNPKGYGRFSVDGKLQYPHRWVFATFVGPIPDGHDIDHLCRNHSCVNPEHLEAVTRAENLRRGLLGFGSGLCRAGLHDTTDPRNVVASQGGKRQCRPCVNASRRAVTS